MRDGCVNYIWHFLLGLDMGELNFEKKKYIENVFKNIYLTVIFGSNNKN